MQARPIRAVIFHNLPAPYRLQWFDHMMKDPDLDIHIFLTGKPKSNRPHWRHGLLADNRRVTILSGFGIPLKGPHNDRFNVNPGFLKFLDLRPDVVLLFGYIDPTNLAVAFVCSLKKIPYILFAEVSDIWNSSVTAKIAAPVVSRIVRNATALAPASTSCARFFESLGGSTEMTTVVPCVPDVQPIWERKASSYTIQELKKRLGVQGAYTVLFIGRLMEFKGVEDAIAAMTLVRDLRSDVTMLVIGDGPMRDFVTHKCDELRPNLVFFGSVDDSTLNDIFSIADLHILPSWHEAFGVVCAEALAYGVPSIVTKTSGCSDLIVNGVNGRVVDPRNPKMLAEAINDCLRSDERLGRLKESAFRMSSDFRMDVVLSKVKRMIETAVR